MQKQRAASVSGSSSISQLQLNFSAPGVTLMAAGVEEMRGCQRCWARLSTLCFWGCLQAGVSEHRWDGPATTLQAQPPGTHAYLHTGPFSQHRLRWRKVLVAQLRVWRKRQQWDKGGWWGYQPVLFWLQASG